MGVFDRDSYVDPLEPDDSEVKVMEFPELDGLVEIIGPSIQLVHHMLGLACEMFSSLDGIESWDGESRFDVEEALSRVMDQVGSFNPEFEPK